ncbi:MAG: LysM peptidoglycan-binding domain-containing protein [Elusimicrobia bacterium]|nr:LysM peptidoglycan-binding domain-containing protein [Elusimicrobiota bacterium]
MTGLILALSAVMMSLGFGQEGASAQRYIVVKGDTLWDIAELFYSNGFDWKKIHDLNQQIVGNPHLIYPEQALVLPDGMAPPQRKPAPKSQEVVVAPPPVAPTAPPAAKEVEVVMAQDEQMPDIAPEPEPKAPSQLETLEAAEITGAPAVLSELKEFKDYDGKVIASRDLERAMFSSGDRVIVSLGAKHGLLKGDILKIVRKKKKIYDPLARKRVWLVDDVGRIRVTSEIYETRSSCEVVYSHDAVVIGDGVLRLPRNDESAGQ